MINILYLSRRKQEIPRTYGKRTNSGETHQTFIAACIRIDSIKVLHVWFPCICQYLLQFLDFQLPGKFQQYAVYQLVVCQRTLRANPDAAEDLIMDVPIQSLHQLRSGQTCVHLQKCQRNLTFWSKEGLSASFNPFVSRMLF